MSEIYTPNYADAEYLKMARYVLEHGVNTSNRTNTGARRIFGYQMRFNLEKGFPLLTSKKVHMRSILLELIWFLRGDTNAKWLQDRNCTIWDEWAAEDGSLGPVYGKQWRDWVSADGQHIDQLKELEALIKTDPNSRRQIVNAWNVGELNQMALMPCHCFFQTACINGRLNLQLYQRSADVFLGVPFNIASYATLLQILAQRTGMQVGEFIWTGGDVHIYENHVEQVELQLSRANKTYAPPQLKIKEVDAIDGYALEDFELVGYQSQPAIKAPVAV